MTVYSKTRLLSDIQDFLPDNTQKAISPQDLRDRLIDIIDTYEFHFVSLGLMAPNVDALRLAVLIAINDNIVNDITVAEVRPRFHEIINDFADQVVVYGGVASGRIALYDQVSTTLVDGGIISPKNLRNLLTQLVIKLQQWVNTLGSLPATHEANPDTFTFTDPWVSETFDILANDVGYVAGNVTMVDEGTGDASGVLSLNNATGELTYTPDPDETARRVTIDVRVTDNTTAHTAVERISLDIPMKPMEIYLGGMQEASEIVDALANGWLEGVNAFLSDQTQTNAWLNECNTSNVNTYVSLDSGMASTPDIDYLLGHANFGKVKGIEVEGGSWTNTLWEYLRDQLGANDHLLHGYQTQFSGQPNVGIDDVSIDGGGVITITTLSPHGLSNGVKVGISGVAGTTEINYLTFTTANVASTTFELLGINGTGYGTYVNDDAGLVWTGSQPAASCWKNRSRLWYPFQAQDPTVSYDPDNVSTSVAISTTSNTNPVTVTTGGHSYVEGQTVTIRNVSGMTEINDRQFTVTNVGGTTFDLLGENGTGYSSGTGGTIETHEDGRAKQVSVRFDSSTEPLRQNGAFWAVAPTERNFHMWLQAFGQPMEGVDWDDFHRTAVQPGVGHMYNQLVLSHFNGARKVSFYTYRNGLFSNRHKDNTQIGSPVDVLHEMDRNTSTNLTAAQATVYERTWERMKEAVAKYKAGPGNLAINTDGDAGYETPFVGVVPYGQSATRR